MVKSVKKFEFANAQSLGRISVFLNGTAYLITDQTKCLIHIFDKHGKYQDSVNPNKCLKEPIGICVKPKDQTEEEIYVSDFKQETIFVFNINFELIKNIGEHLRNVQYISLDKNVIIISHRKDDCVTLLNASNGQILSKMFIEQPVHSKANEDKIFIVSRFDGEFDMKKLKCRKITKGNYINVIDKSNLHIIHKIQFDDWFAPHSLHLSTDSNIYTTAKVMDEKGHVSKSRYLMIIDSSYNLRQKIKLNEIHEFSDALYLDNKVMLCAVNEFDNGMLHLDFM